MRGRLRRIPLAASLVASVAFGGSEAHAESSAVGGSGMHAESSASGVPAQLSLEDVLRSADENFPLLQAMRLEGEARAFAEREALGAFDTSLGMAGDLRPEGFYENYGGSAYVDQPTRWWGSRFYARYRYAEGDFPSYEGGRQTDGSGEVRLGVDLPLLRGGPIDRSRLALRAARIDQQRFTPELRLARVQVLRDASVSFWEWVAAGQIVEITEALLRVADERQSQIEGRVARGGEAAINLDDNARLVVERRALLLGAERDFEQAAIRLSLFWRDEMGRPRLPDPTSLPTVFPAEIPVDRAAIARDLEEARKRHPMLEELAFQREKLALEVRLARNELLSDLDLVVEGARDFGNSRPGIDETGKRSSAPRGESEVKALVRFEIPVQRRAARGRLGRAEIRLAQLDRRVQFAAEQVIAEAGLAVEALEAAYLQTAAARENARLAERLRRAEARKLAAGLSNLIDLNIRETQAATAERDLVRAQQAYFKAVADYEARIARTS